jgi:tyrosyl-tRNA synthetase
MITTHGNILAEAKRLIQSGGLYVCGSRVSEPRMLLRECHLLDGQIAIIRKGKSSFHILDLC